jgi:hypothetical protein
VSAVPGQWAQPLQYSRAIRDSDLPTGARATCWALATFARNESGRAWPSLKILSKATGLTPAIISKHTGLAEERGYLHKERRFNGSIIYTITIPITGETPGTPEAGAFPVEPPLG